MKELETLLNRRWILKSEDKELYYKIRDAVGEIRKYSTDKLGCQIIDNSLLVKMEKNTGCSGKIYGNCCIRLKGRICIFMCAVNVSGR